MNAPSVSFSTRAEQANGIPSDLPPSDRSTVAPTPAATQAATLSASLIRQTTAPFAPWRTSSASNSVVSPWPPPPGLSWVSASTTGRLAPAASRLASATASADGRVSCTKLASCAFTYARNASAAASAWAWVSANAAIAAPQPAKSA